ncbi:DotU family type IV/VI secretion system protein, partial [Salmonella enterica subsp. enterica serovar Montevideo]|nr:DotU family type IV/VI secretion system protein [Salmonella enterica subsp. enterica serovar Montevideo]
EMHLYQTLCDQANLRREHVLAVRYCLCTALDEAANNTTWGRRVNRRQSGGSGSEKRARNRGKISFSTITLNSDGTPGVKNIRQR